MQGSLDSLGMTFCPELGRKGSIPHSEVDLLYINNPKHKIDLIEYMKQDIRLLGGILLKAQEIFFTKYSIDIEDAKK